MVWCFALGSKCHGLALKGFFFKHSLKSGKRGSLPYLLREATNEIPLQKRIVTDLGACQMDFSHSWRVSRASRVYMEKGNL